MGRGVVPRLRLGDARPDAGRRAAALAAGEDGDAALSGRAPGAPNLGGERLSDLESGRALGARTSGTGWVTYAVDRRARGVPRCSAASLLERRRRRRLPPPALRPLAEFERALRRARFDGGPGMTLSGIEREFAGWPGAAGYVRALREQRYSGRPAAPTRASSAAACARRSRATPACCARGGRCRRGGREGGLAPPQVARRRRAPPLRLRRRCPARPRSQRPARRSSPPAACARRRSRLGASPLPPRAWARNRAPQAHDGPLGPWVAPRTSGAEWDQKESHMTRHFSLLVDDRPEMLLRVTGLCLRRRADVVALRYGRSRHPGWARLDLELAVTSATAAGSPSGWRAGRGP